MKQILKPSVRRWAYAVAGAGLVVAGVYGLVDGDQAQALLLLVGALFGVAHQNVNEG